MLSVTKNLHWDFQKTYEESPVDSCNTKLKETPELTHNKDCFLKILKTFSVYAYRIQKTNFIYSRKSNKLTLAMYSRDRTSG